MLVEILRAKLPDVRDIEYALRAGGSKPIVFIRGYADSWYSFKGVLEFFTGRVCCCCNNPARSRRFHQIAGHLQFA